MDIIEILNSFAAQHPWIFVVVTIYVAVVTAIKGIRDAIDSTPNTDDNLFEKIATILWKTIGYVIGIRPKK